MSWPHDLTPQGAAGWQRDATNWLLDRCPSEFRSYEVFRVHPEALAHVALKHLDRQVESIRDAYRSARTETQLNAEVLTELLQTLEKEGARLALEHLSAETVCVALVSASRATDQQSENQ